MRVITGLARGMRLKTLEGNAVRPTSEKVKEAVFSMLQFDIEGRRVLDLFAGCGQMGIEALSRGAESVTFVDASMDSIKTIEENLKATRLKDNARVEKRDFKMFLSSCREQFDIAFLDPPYHEGFYSDALALLSPLMSSYGIIVCEHPSDVTLPETVDDFRVAKQSRYGKICISVYRRLEA